MATLAEVGNPPAGEREPSRVRSTWRWPVLSCYLLAAVALTWRLWADPAGRTQAGDPHDVDSARHGERTRAPGAGTGPVFAGRLQSVEPPGGFVRG